MIKKLIATLICIFALPVLVYADMGAPESYHYEIIITNPNGATLEDYSGEKITIPYDTKLTVHYETKMDGELYLDVEYNDTYGVISADDVKIYTTEINFDEFAPNTDGRQFYTIDNVEMYKGPSTMYGKVGKIIPKGKILDYDYSDSLWAYLDYEGTKGWIFIFPVVEMVGNGMTANVVEVLQKPKQVIVLKDKITLYEDRLQKNIVGELPVGEYDVLYYSSTYVRNPGYYVQTDTISGWLYLGENDLPKVQTAVISSQSKMMHKFNEPLQLYKNLYDEEPVNLTLDAYTMVDSKYSVIIESTPIDEWDYAVKQAYQIVYNGEIYWVKGDSEKFLVSYSKGNYKLNKDITVYSAPQSTEVVTTIKSGNTATLHMSEYVGDKYWYYVEYEDYKGWIEYISLDYAQITWEQYDEVILTPETPEEPAEPTKPEEKESLTGLQIGLICGGAALIATLTAIVSIVLVNKKKKNKVEEPVVATEPKQENATTDNTIKVPSTTGVLPVVKEEDQNDEK